MKERDFYRPVQNWAKKNLNQTAVIELKLVKIGKFKLSDMREHQISSLLECKHRNMSYKIPDAGFDQKPFDICFWSKTLAYVGVIFYEPRKKKNLYLIDIDSLVSSTRTNHSEEELSEMADHRIRLAS